MLRTKEGITPKVSTNKDTEALIIESTSTLTYSDHSSNHHKVQLDLKTDLRSTNKLNTDCLSFRPSSKTLKLEVN